MDLGHLNIPKPEMDRVSFIPDLPTKLFIMYSRLIEDGSYAADVLRQIEADPRVQALKGTMVSHGSGASSFDTRVLAMWFLWAVNEYGAEIAQTNLDRFLDSQLVPVMNCLWVLGIEADRTIELDDGVQIVPIAEMPTSREKEHFQQHEFNFAPHQMPKPKAAITSQCDVVKTVLPNTRRERSDENQKFWEVTQQLADIALLLNAVEGVSCVPYFSTSYSLSDMPPGIFAGSGGGFSLYDVFGYRSSKLSAGSTDQINELRRAFVALTQTDRIRMGRVLSRLSQAKRRRQIEDKILDLGIAMEMALLDDNKSHDQLSLTFRLRGSWFIATDYEERQVIYQQLNEIYQYRSQVAHSGVLAGNDRAKIQYVIDHFPEYALLSERIVRALIFRPHPDWKSLILGTTAKSD